MRGAEPPVEPLPWWAAGVCDECMEPVDTLFRTSGPTLCGSCHPSPPMTDRPGVYPDPAQTVNLAEDGGFPGPGDFGDGDIPF